MLHRMTLLALSLFCFPAVSWAAEALPLPVVVSIAPQKYMLERIAGDSIQVAVLVSPGADPHSYEPGPSVMRGCANAKAWFTVGIAFEDLWRERIEKLSPGMAVISSIKGIKRLPYHTLETLGHKDKLAEQAETGEAEPGHSGELEGHGHEHEHKIDHEHDEEAPHSHSGEDPHVWLSPMLAREMLPHLARELGRLIPGKATEFRARARAFADELETLDEELAGAFQSVPEAKRVFLTFHPSWQYFALNYQLKELSIETDGKEPGPKTMKAVIDTAKAYGVTTVFIEPQFSKSAARAIAQSIGAEVIETDPLAEDLPALYKSMAAKLLKSFSK